MKNNFLLISFKSLNFWMLIYYLQDILKRSQKSRRQKKYEKISFLIMFFTLFNIIILEQTIQNNINYNPTYVKIKLSRKKIKNYIFPENIINNFEARKLKIIKNFKVSRIKKNSITLIKNILYCQLKS